MRPLRLAVLRPGQAPEAAVWPGDDDPDTGHFGVLGPRREAPLAVGSVVREPLPGRDDDGRAWRVRGMATDPAARGRGLGTQVLTALVDHARARGAAVLWCHARVRAVGLYERAGFRTVGEPYDHGELGAHRLLVADLPAASARR